MTTETVVRIVVPLVVAALTAYILMMAVVPYHDCSRSGGLPVVAPGRIVCAQPFNGKTAP